jgi:hypothetical protein
MYCIFYEKISRWLTLQSHTTESIREKCIQYRLRRICTFILGVAELCRDIIRLWWLELFKVHLLRHTSKDSLSSPNSLSPLPQCVSWLQPDVGKMTTLYLYINLRHVMSATSFKLKKSVGSRGYTFFLERWKSRGIGRNVFYIEMIFRDPDRQRSIKIAVEGKTHLLVYNF